MTQPDGFYTYELIVHTEEKGVLWTGTIDGRPVEGPGGVPGLEFSPNGLPADLIEVLKANPICRVEWNEAWEDITPTKETDEE